MSDSPNMELIPGLGYTRIAGSFAMPDGGWAVPKGKNAEWWFEDICVMLQHAEAERATAADGLKFKGTPLENITNGVNAVLRSGAEKSEDSVSRKLAEVLKIYSVVSYLKGLDGKASGLTWNDVTGASISENGADTNVWNGIVSKRPSCKPFRNHGWDLYDYVTKVQPSKAKGDYVVRAGTGAVGAYRPPSPVADHSVLPSPALPPPPTAGDDPEVSSDPQAAGGNAAAGPAAPSTPAPVSRKRSATSTASSTSSTSKRTRTAADGLFAIGDKFGEFKDAFLESTREISGALRPANDVREAIKVLSEKDKPWLDRHGKFRKVARHLNDHENDAKFYLNMAQVGSSPRRETLRDIVYISDTEPEED